MMANELLGAPEIHSINKILTCFELQREWKELSLVDSLYPIGVPFDQSRQPPLIKPASGLKKQSSILGTMFSLGSLSSRSSSNLSLKDAKPTSPSDSKDRMRANPLLERPKHLPLFRLMFQQVWRVFPGLNNLPTETWLGIENLILDFNRRNFSTSRERREFTKRAVVSVGLTKLLSSYITSVIRFEKHDSQPTRPSEKDINLISQLPRLISSFGSRIKFIKWPNDECLVICRKSTDTPKLSIDCDSSQAGSPLLISVVKWRVLSKFLQKVDASQDHRCTEFSFILLQKYYNNQSPQSTKLHQILQDTQLSTESLSDEIKEEINHFLTEEQSFREEWLNSGIRVSEAKEGYKKFLRRAVYEEGEVDRLYNLVGQHEKLESLLALDPIYEQAQTWAVIWLAYLLHFIFIGGPCGDELSELMIKVDKLIPHELIKQGLKIVNPTLAIRTTVALILGQPFGSLSLFQRILDSIIRQEIRSFDHQIDAILQSYHLSIDKPSPPNPHKFFEAIKTFVYLSEQEKRETRFEFDKSGEDIIILILRWSQNFNELEIKSAQENVQTRSSDGSVSTSETFFMDLISFLRLTSLKRDREQLLEMILEPDNPIVRIIKQILEMYYPTIYKVALASDLSKKFCQLDAFLKDLVSLLGKRKQEKVTVENMVQLLNDHKQSYWSFLNDLVKSKNLCDPIKNWIRSCFDLVKSGLSQTGEDGTTERFGLKVDKVGLEVGLDRILEESRALSMYNRLTKMMDNIHYRLIFCDSPVPSETDWLVQAFHMLSKLDEAAFAPHLAQSKLDARPPLPFGWAWWINAQYLCGSEAETLNQSPPSSNEEPGPSDLVVNSDLKGLKKSSVYLDDLIASIRLFDLHQSVLSPSSTCPSSF